MSTRHAVRLAAIALAVSAASVTVGAAHASARPHQKIAFTSNRSGENEIVVANAKGRHRVDLTPGRSPEWSPNGRKIAFTSTRDGNSSVYVMDADGSNQTRLTVAPVYDSRPHWSGDGKKIVFLRITDSGNWDIFRMKADGSNLVDLTNNPANEWGPATQDDQIVFTREENGVGHLFVMGIDGKGLRRITNTSLYDSYPGFSSDGHLVVFLRDSTPDGNGDDIWVVGANGQGERQLTHQSATGYVINPTFSPDGSEIMYAQCGPAGANPCALHVMNADGTNDRDISTPAVPYRDRFNGDQINSSFWWTNLVGTGPTFTQANGHLEMTVPPDTALDPSAGYMDINAGSLCRLQGDFDMQLDYNLDEWAPTPMVNVDLSAQAFDAAGNYTGVGGGVFVFDPGGLGLGVSTNFQSAPNTYAPYPALSGTLRLVRAGDTLTALYKNRNRWVTLGSEPFRGASASAVFDLFSNAPPGSHPEIKVDFDNFRVSSGAFTCPTWWNDADAAWRP